IDEKIASRDTLTLNANVLKDGYCGYFIGDETITILARIEAQEPVAVLNSPNLLGICHDLVLESASYRYGPLKYKWEYFEPASVSQYSLNIEYLLGNLSDTTTSVTIPANYIETGVFGIKLTVTDSYL